MTEQPASELLPTVYLHAWLKLDSCATLGYFSATFRFTWHGLPLEVVTPAPACGYGWYEISSGGLMDVHAYLIPWCAPERQAESCAVPRHSG
ncbi:MAG TPA: hypothetical protein VF792_04020 [Ktedonobacterales bacterium]